jgi:hypothetical protein
MKNKVVSLEKRKHRNLVLSAYDQMESADKRELAEKRAQKKRDSKNKF